MSSYLPHKSETGNVEHDWREHTWRALAFQYGPERADAIYHGSDPRTQADIIRWNSLGRKDAA